MKALTVYVGCGQAGELDEMATIDMGISVLQSVLGVDFKVDGPLVGYVTACFDMVCDPGLGHSRRCRYDGRPEVPSPHNR